MLLVAATFADEAAAHRVLSELRRRYDLRPIDADVAPLGTAGDGATGVVVLAGRFRESVVRKVEELIEQAGGAIVAEVDEAKAEHPARVEEETKSWTH